MHLNYSALAIFTTHGQRQADRVKFHADRRRNFCRREYVLYETRDHRFHRTYGEITITAQRKLHNLFVYGRSQTAGYLPPRAVLKERSSNFYNATNFLPPPLPLLYRSFTLNLLPIGGTARMDSSLSRAPRDREEKEGPSDRKHQPACLSFLRAIILLWTQLCERRMIDFSFFSFIDIFPQYVMENIVC